MPSSDSYAAFYDVSPVEDRFVLVQETERNSVTRLNIVVHWSQELDSLVAVD